MASSTYGLLSPANSTASTSMAGTHHGPDLPISRVHPLKPGSRKESALINYLDDRILRITRRYGKKFSNSEEDTDDVKGYERFDEVIDDLNSTFEVVWISGTPLLQIPYLLTIAGLFCSYMQAFPFSTAIFKFVKRLDEAFASLLRPSSKEAGNTTPYRVSTTDQVRIKSLAEESRVIAVDVAAESGIQSEMIEADSDIDDTSESNEDDLSRISMDLSKVYLKTIEILGDSLI